MKRMLWILICTLLLSSCSLIGGIGKEKTPTETPTPESTETPIPTPEPTAPPSAAVVNGEYVWLDDYNAKRDQLRDAYAELGEEVPGDEDLSKEAIDSLVNETLFQAAAVRSGAVPSDAELDERIRKLADEMGGADALRDWQNRHHYTEESFRRALKREIAEGTIREQVCAEKLASMEQVHVYRISSTARGDLTSVQNDLGLGFSFVELAKKKDTLTGGDMSWFPRGVMFAKDLEDAIFALEPDSVSDILEHDGTYYLFYVAEKQTGHAMDAQVEQIVRSSIMDEWLANERSQASVEITVQ